MSTRSEKLQREREAVERVAKRISEHTGKSHSEARRQAVRIAEEQDRQQRQQGGER